jgi:hypothetical protein
VWINGGLGTSFGNLFGLQCGLSPTVNLPASLFVTGQNLLAVRGTGIDMLACLDVSLRFQCCYCIVAGPGHPTGSLPCSCLTSPRPSTYFCVSFSDPPPIGLGYSLLYLGAGPCANPPFVLNDPVVCTVAFFYVAPLLVLATGGTPSTFCVLVPQDPVVVGMNFCLQGAALEVGSCFRATDGVSVTVQP